jgi:SAM-dependent methyltransferase
MSLDDVRATWEKIGRDDPFWGVLTWEGTEHGKWDIEEFFSEGEREVAAFMDEARALRALPEVKDVLDFGCGVGRLSRALATRFESVTGLDVSAPMVEQATRLVTAGHPNATFQVSISARLPFSDNSFDLVLSNIVLQHMPPKLARGYIREFLRVLRPEGVAIFQIPSENRMGSTSANPLLRAAMNALPSQVREEIHRRRVPDGPRDLPMNGIPRAKVLRFVERHGGRVIACIEDTAAGVNWRSFHYIVRVSRNGSRRDSRLTSG